MKREILISEDSNEKRVAILEDGRLEEYYIERSDASRMCGHIYKGIVKSIVPGMQAAFVDLGTKKDGFLYVADALNDPSDMDVEFDDAPTERGRDHRRHERMKRIEDVLKNGQEIIVQVVKDPIRSKGPRLTTCFSLPARYLVMMPGESKVGVSRRIEDRRERDRIRGIFKQIEIPKGAGFIVRTAAEGKSEKEFIRDIRYLTKLWKKIQEAITAQQKRGSALIHEELDLVERTIRDHMTDDTHLLITDSPEIKRQVQKFLSFYIPDSHMDVLYHDSKISLFEKYNIEKEIERTFQKNVILKSGGHIVIEQTEGLVAIDVNTGKFTGSKNLEETVFKTNMEAADEVARQLRLRDVGGIIIIDFIDLDTEDHRRQLFRTFKEAMRRDRAKTNLLQISELGLVEMTRQRMRPSLESAVYDACPYCEGKGRVKSPTTMVIQAVKEIRKALGHTQGKVLNVYVHPKISERLLEQEKKTLQELEKMHHCRIFAYADHTLHIEDVNITFIK
ncbi:MAG: Rne/Rng family ribonuclease [Candidatus Omnitrophica bacterium]|nr:Rne/Rng family ribonuclease [Candidatus Omnitrophota bacterium]